MEDYNADTILADYGTFKSDKYLTIKRVDVFEDVALLFGESTPKTIFWPGGGELKTNQFEASKDKGAIDTQKRSKNTVNAYLALLQRRQREFGALWNYPRVLLIGPDFAASPTQDSPKLDAGSYDIVVVVAYREKTDYEACIVYADRHGESAISVMFETYHTKNGATVDVEKETLKWLNKNVWSDKSGKYDQKVQMHIEKTQVNSVYQILLRIARVCATNRPRILPDDIAETEAFARKRIIASFLMSQALDVEPLLGRNLEAPLPRTVRAEEVTALSERFSVLRKRATADDDDGGGAATDEDLSL